MLPPHPTPGPPLHPSGDEGRRLLREELLHGEYHRQHLWQRLLDWLGRVFDGGVSRASHSSWVTVLVTMVLVALLVVGLAWVLSRLRRDRRTRRRAAEAVLPHDRPAASELRRRAETALAEGRHSAALVEGFRALAARQVEQHAIEDQPGATAHELAAGLAAAHPSYAALVARCADLFDATLYGDHPASERDAEAVLGLDDALRGLRRAYPVGAR